MKNYFEVRKAGYGVYSLQVVENENQVIFSLITAKKIHYIAWRDGDLEKMLLKITTKKDQKTFEYKPEKNNIREIMENMSPIFIKMIARVYEGIFEI